MAPRTQPRLDDIALRALRSMPGAVVCAYDHDLRILLAAGPARAWGGRDPSSLTGERLADVLPSAAYHRLAPRLRRALKGRPETFAYRTIDGAFDLEITAAPLHGDDGRITGAAAVARPDPGEALARKLADHDPLTGVFTRERLQEELGRVVALADRYGEPGVVGVIDLDNFRYVNDAHGHGMGDHLLAQAATVLRGRLRETDAFGRLGSDEFAFILPRTALDAGAEVAAALLRALRDAAIVVGGERLRLSASVGLAPIEPAAEGVSAADLLAEADIAMYAAKEAGRDRVETAAPGQRSLSRVRASLSWAGRISHALENDRLVLYSQPILNLAEDRVDRHELLLRMVGDDGEPVAPGEFLSTAERFGQMPAIDRWVIGRALEFLAATPAGDPVLEVNLSAASVTDAETVAFIRRSVDEAGIDPSRLIFEITETAAIADIVRAGVLAERLRELGCRFALDDFGAGFGSLYYLKHLPFHVIKIDGEFIKDLPRSREDRLTVRAIAEMARGTGKITIAEFVQDAETVALLRELGVDLAQGLHVGMPAPVEPGWRGMGG
ncbi:MAG: EAL domain-containing protein [Actinomycetota bacterium]|nr:EAL domain-containing protein [Actinomycetota bacterium]